MQLIRQMQQKCVPECTSFVFNMAAEIEGDVECSVAAFMEELQRYESLCNKFSKDYMQKLLASIEQEVQYDGGRSGEKVQEHSLKLPHIQLEWKPKVHNCRITCIELCLRCRGLV